MLLDWVVPVFYFPASDGSNSVSDERRQFQRLNLTKPVDGWFGDYSVIVVEVSANGAKILHDDQIPVGARGLLRFSWRGQDLELTAEIVRTEGGSSGLWLIDDSKLLRDLIEASATELLRAQEANLLGDRERNVVGDETLTAASAGARASSGFLQFHLTPEGWKCQRALLPDQPDDGFTVSANESQEQIDLLCRTYETGDPEAKRMTRMIAELSVTR